jgi:dihydroxyacetone kinase-like protein
MEIGVGIHGEPGRVRMKMETADQITERMALAIIEDEAYSRTVREFDEGTGTWVDVALTDPPFQAGDEVIAFVNSMGGTPVSELYAVYRKLDEICQAKGLKIVRNLIGPYITSLEMAGASITLLKVDAEILKFWDAPVNTPGLRWGV